MQLPPQALQPQFPRESEQEKKDAAKATAQLSPFEAWSFKKHRDMKGKIAAVESEMSEGVFTMIRKNQHYHIKIHLCDKSYTRCQLLQMS